MQPVSSPEISVLASPELKQRSWVTDSNLHPIKSVSKASKPNDVSSNVTYNSRHTQKATKPLNEKVRETEWLIPKREKTPADAFLIETPSISTFGAGNGKPKKPYGGDFGPKDDISKFPQASKKYGKGNHNFSFSRFLPASTGSYSAARAAEYDPRLCKQVEPPTKRRRIKHSETTPISGDGASIKFSNRQDMSSKRYWSGTHNETNRNGRVHSLSDDFSTGKAAEFHKVENNINPERDYGLDRVNQNQVNTASANAIGLSSRSASSPINGTKCSPIVLQDNLQSGLTKCKRRRTSRSPNVQSENSIEEIPQISTSYVATPTKSCKKGLSKMASFEDGKSSTKAVRSPPISTTTSERAKEMRYQYLEEAKTERRDSIDELQGVCNLTPSKTVGEEKSSQYGSNLLLSTHTSQKPSKKSGFGMENAGREQNVEYVRKVWPVEMYRTNLRDFANVLVFDGIEKCLEIKHNKGDQNIEILDKSKIHRVRYSVASGKVIINGPRRNDSAMIHAFCFPQQDNCRQFIQKLTDMEICEASDIRLIDFSKMDNMYDELAKKREERQNNPARSMNKDIQSDKSTQATKKRRTSLSCPDSESKRLRNDNLLGSEVASKVEEQKPILFDPSPEPARSPERAAEQPNNHKLEPWPESIVYPSTGANRTTVEFEDVVRLNDGEFLNDNIISFYLRYLSEYSGQYKDKVYFFNTYFYTRLTSGAKKPIDYEAVQKWTSKVNIFDYEYLVFPVNHSLHWYLVIIGNSLFKESTPCPDRLKASPTTSPSRTIWPSEHKLEHRNHDNTAYRQDHITSRLGNDLHKLALDEPDPAVDSTSLPHSQEMLYLDSVDTSIVSERNISKYFNRRKSTETNDGRLKTVRNGDKKLSNMSSPSKLATKEDKTKEQPPFILVSLDSFGESRPQVLKALKLYLVEEAKSKLNRELDPKTFKGATAKGIPLQHNGCDCGVYLLGYAEKFMQNPRRFMEKLVNREMSVKGDWPEMDPRQMRKEIRQKLYEVQQAQENGRQRRLAAKQGRNSKKNSKMPTTNQEASKHKDETQKLDSPQMIQTTDNRRLNDDDISKKHNTYKVICSSVSDIIKEKSPILSGNGKSPRDLSQASEATERKQQLKAPEKNNQMMFYEQLRSCAESV